MSKNTVISIRGQGQTADAKYAVDSTPQGATHLSSAAQSSGRKAVAKWKLGLLGFACLVSVGLIAVGAIIPKIVESTIEATVHDTVLLDVAEMKAAGQEKFLNSSSPMDFFLYSVTNLHAVLTDTTGATRLNFEEVGPFNLIKYSTKYDVEYNGDRTTFKYKQLTTFAVADAETEAKLDTVIVGPNPLYFGMGQQVMQMMESGSSLFTRLNDQVTHIGVLGQMLLPQVMSQFTRSTDTLLTALRVQAIAFYIGYAQGYAAGAPDIDWASVKAAWAAGTPLLSTHNATLWDGFELLPANKLTSTNPTLVADNLFDEANVNSLASPLGIGKWGAIIPQLLVAPNVQTTEQQAISAALGITDHADMARIAGWVMQFQTPVSLSTGDPNPYYAPYEKVCTASIAAQVKTVRDAITGSVVEAAYNDTAAFEPTSWEDVGALQFSTGFMVGVAFNPTKLGTTGMGESIRVLTGEITGYTAPMNFENRATLTWGGVEPPEFFGGIDYYVKHLPAVPTPTLAASDPTRMLWDKSRNPAANPELLYVLDPSNSTARTTFLPLTIAQSRQLLAAITDIDKFQVLFSGINMMVGAYSQGYQMSGSHATGYAAAGSALSPELAACGVSGTNFFAIYTYVSSYLLNEFAGPLTLLDPLTGLAPQNTGLFTQRTAREMLFGYVSRFGPNMMVPGIAGVQTDWSQLDARIAAERPNKMGKDIEQYTGKGDFDRIGQFVQYAGVKKYQTWCELHDPASTGDCATPAGRAARNEELYLSPVTVTGGGDGMNQGPLKEDEIVPMYTLYVDEAKRIMPLVYNHTHATVRDITMRRYHVGNDVLVGDNYFRNKTQLRFDDDQQVPDGFTSVQSVMNGMPLLLGLPRFGPVVSADFDAGVTCTAADGTPGHLCQSTYRYDDHGTWVDVEPITGMTMYGRKRLQANFRTSKQELFTQLADTTMKGVNSHYNNVFKSSRFDDNPNLILPYYWADLNDMLKDKDVEDFNDAMDAMAAGRKMGDIVQIAGLTVGAVGVFASVGAIIFLVARK